MFIYLCVKRLFHWVSITACIFSASISLDDWFSKTGPVNMIQSSRCARQPPDMKKNSAGRWSKDPPGEDGLQHNLATVWTTKHFLSAAVPTAEPV